MKKGNYTMAEFEAYTSSVEKSLKKNFSTASPQGEALMKENLHE